MCSSDLTGGALQVFYFEVLDAVRPKGSATASLGWLWTIEGSMKVAPQLDGNVKDAPVIFHQVSASALHKDFQKLGWQIRNERGMNNLLEDELVMVVGQGLRANVRSCQLEGWIAEVQLCMDDLACRKCHQSLIVRRCDLHT